MKMTLERATWLCYLAAMVSFLVGITTLAIEAALHRPGDGAILNDVYFVALASGITFGFAMIVLIAIRDFSE